MVYNDGLFLNEECEIIAVRIRTVSVTDVDATVNQNPHIMWPNIPGTTLLFSSKKKFYTANALDNKDDIDFYDFHKAIKPKYG